MNTVLLLALQLQPPDLFALTFPTDPGQWVVLLLYCAGAGALFLVFAWRLGRILRRLPPGSLRQRWRWQGSGGLLLGIGGFWACQVLWLLWYYTLGHWYDQQHRTVAVPYQEALNATWWLWLLAALLGAIGATLYTKAKAQAQQAVEQMSEIGV